MAGREGPRPGGRSARVQASVHGAVQALMTRMERAEITIPMIAVEAGVTPSTIYRRWGDIQELLADVAVERLKPDMQPVDTGNGGKDLLAWAEQYAEEMSSKPGREMIRDVLAAQDGSGAYQCCNFTKQQIEVIAARAADRGEAFPEVDAVMDRVVSPIMYRILFGEAPDTAHVARLVSGAMGLVSKAPASV
ncbi:MULTISPECIES: TetR/AcrR family transcriptional regulator [Ensifer]|jgi:AcrR family transcriptional regulator|uniref:TetR family transcriptional regulator n=1 Tax=Ensifer canadensis TaxID=555315 RepID=A0AAW4FW21_9HYPH|nr:MULTISPECIES: TetR/AcrR family transcriptional regulator [Ensifer]KQU88869.1 TetR family transcriptional regulator [Ensifer sp. Root31]KQY72749.1 TetR family transcriptional regulator [Ensifer sp. Root142]MBD9487041.1 TetR/AcrR family transcriptional regulator C-terminal ligand-binding domain-containing protein [Ensifer sp. ENS11]MBM3095646.1 TetR family transcriptional regulator [Ensifer canadensis]NOV17530.1 TetR/AcrR family transcriptional regulator [Ensifer canadensis]